MKQKTSKFILKVFFVVLFAVSLVFSVAGLTACMGDTGATGPAGADGKSAYEIYLSTVPAGQTPMTESQWLASLSGTDGRTAYQIYVSNVPAGEEIMSRDEWLASLQGDSAYDLYKKNTSDNPVKTEDEWLDSLKGLSGVNSLSKMEYVKNGKWGIIHQLQISYTTENGEQEQMLTTDTLRIIDQNVYYTAESSEDIWQLLDYGVSKIRLANDVSWQGNSIVSKSVTGGQLKYASVIKLEQDVNFGLNGHKLTIDALSIDVTSNAAVTFKNGDIERAKRTTSSVLDVDGTNYNIATDAEYGITEGEPAMNVDNYCSLLLDAVDLYSVYDGIYIEGVCAELEVKNSTVKVEGRSCVDTSVSLHSRWSVLIDIADSELIVLDKDSNGNIINYGSGDVPDYDGIAVVLSVPGSVNIDKCTIVGRTSAVLCRGGYMDVRNSTLTTSTGYETGDHVGAETSWDGTSIPNYTVVVGHGVKGLAYQANLLLSNVTISKAENTKNLIHIFGNSGEGNGYDGEGNYVGAALTYDAMTFARSGGVDMHIEKANDFVRIYRPEMLLNANEWYIADSQYKIRDLLEFGAQNIRLADDLIFEANTAEGEYEGYTVIDSDMQLGLNGHTITVVSKGIIITGNAEVRFMNGTIIMNNTASPDVGSVDGDYAIVVKDFCGLTLEAVKMFANRSGIFMDGMAASLDVIADSEVYVGGFYGIGTNVNGTQGFGVIVTIKYSKIVAVGSVMFPIDSGIEPEGQQDPDDMYGVAVLFNVPGTLKVEKQSTLEGCTQGVILRDGIAIVENSTIRVTGKNANLDKYSVSDNGTHSAWGRGYLVPSAAVVVGTYNTRTAAGTDLYQNQTDLTLRNVKLEIPRNTEGEAGVTYYIYAHNDNVASATTVISFDTLTAWKSLGNENRFDALVSTCDATTNDSSNLEIWDERDFGTKAAGDEETTTPEVTD